MDELARTAELLRRDVVSTVGEPHGALITHAVATALTLDRNDRPAKVVEDVQQALHDMFVDTTWPACPLHPNHPLAFRDGGWWCERDRNLIAPLGQLSAASTNR